MIHEFLRNVQVELLRAFKTLIVYALAIPPMIALSCILVVIVLEILFGLPGGALALDFVESASGPLIHVADPALDAGLLGLRSALLALPGLDRSVRIPSDYQAIRQVVRISELLAANGTQSIHTNT